MVFYSVIKPPKLNQKLRRVNIGLGILGKTNKVERVIPNKLYELVAMKIPVVSADTPAVREQFVNKQHLYLIPKADTQAIKQAFLELKDNPELGRNMAENAYKHMKANLVPKVLGRKLLPQIEKFLAAYDRSS